MGRRLVAVHWIGAPEIGVLDGRAVWLCEVEVEIDGVRRSIPIFGEDAPQARDLADRFAAKVTGDGAPAIGGDCEGP